MSKDHAGYKTNIQKYAVFPYINNELSEREIKKIIPFTIASKRLKYIGINLAKSVKDMYNKTIKYCWKKLKIT